MYIVVIGWGYVALMMAAAEAGSRGGTLLGALITLMLYGVLPLSIVMYLGGAPRRAARRRGRVQRPSRRRIQTAAAIRPVTLSRRNE